MEKTLLVWESSDGATLYLIPSALLMSYESLHCKYVTGAIEDIALTKKEIERNDRIWHLGIMLGEEEYIGEAVPTLAEYLAEQERDRETPRDDAETVGVEHLPEAASAPFARYRFTERILPTCHVLRTGITL